MNKYITDGLTVLSFGAGQDSTCILYKIILDPVYRAQFVKGDFIVIMADTGDEHHYTYEHVEFIAMLCKTHGVEFYFLQSKDGYHPRTWPTLLGQLRKANTIMSVAFSRSCTDNLKIKPFYNFLNVHIARKYYGEDLPASTRNKTYIKQFASEYGKINVILGIAKGEEHRIKRAGKPLQLNLFNKLRRKGSAWEETSITKVFPLITEGIDRAKAQIFIKSTGLPLPMPSNCKRCPFLSKPEILWLYRFFPDDFIEWVELENNKITMHPGKTCNYGVKGAKLLPAILEEAIEEFGHWTNEQLNEYKLSHGHCVRSAF